MNIYQKNKEFNTYYNMNKKVGNYYVDVTSEKYLLTVCDLLDKDSNWNYGRMLDTKEEAIEHIDTLESLNISDFLVKITVVYFNKYGYSYPGKVILRKKLKNNKIKESKIMNKKIIRLTESDLHRIVKESVNRILKEYSDDYGIESDYDFYGTYGNPSQYIRNSEADFDGQAGRSRDLFPYKRGLASLSAQSEKPKKWRGDDLQFVDEPDDEAWSSKINGCAGISPKIARMEKGWDKAFNPNKADIVYHGNDEDNINHATWDN